MQQYLSKMLWFVFCFFISINELVADEYTLSSNLKTISHLNVSPDSIQKYRDFAIELAKSSQSKESVKYIIKYISATSDMSFLNDHLFKTIENSKEYQELKKKYTPKMNFLGIFYFCTGILGLLVFVILNIKKSKNRIGNILISLFVLFNAIFILHLMLYVMNIQFYFPHALLVSTTFSFLYGPLLYFYFKRIIYGYRFKLFDVIHLFPSLILLIYLSPYYFMSRLDKFNEIFDQANILLPGAYSIIIIKILSLTVYAYLLIRIYTKNSSKLNNEDKHKHLWQRNIISLYVIYVMAYIIYAAVLVNVIINYPILFHLQTLVMVGVVYYVTYISFVQPEIFRGEIEIEIKLVDPTSLFKYKKSGLTPSYSIELADDLLKLLNEDKIYKENNIDLELLSEKLETTRHNVSQIINEQFEMSFSELMNKYRILEAVEILKNDEFNNIKIIQVAYEVGFNNKVSFNKSFKKHLSQTPSQYIESLQQ